MQIRIKREHLNGILGTVAFHLVILIFFLSFKVSMLKREDVEIIIDFSQEELLQEKEEKQDNNEIAEIPIPALSEEQRRNIAVNTAEEMDEQISTEKYIQQLKQELNINDPEEHWKEKLEARFNDPSDTISALKEEEINPYAGPTNISYYLPGRNDRYLHLPIYKCREFGIVCVQIVVDQRGRVVSVAIDPAKSTSEDECLIDAATDAASKSIFNGDIGAPDRQEGAITYHFKSQ